VACQGRFLSGAIEGATRSLVANLSLPACRSREFDAAKQFVGWAVASIIRATATGSSTGRGFPANCLPWLQSGEEIWIGDGKIRSAS
jgi:hypothetical protein